MDVNTLRITMTIISFVVFAGIVAWAMAPANRKSFQDAALIPLDDDDTVPSRGETMTGARHG